MDITSLKEQTKDYKYKIELHAHTKPVSPCSEIPPAELISRYKAKGFDAVVITNHMINFLFDGKTDTEAIEYYLDGYRQTKDEGEKQGIKVLLGLEMRFPENANDYLVFGVDEADVKEMYSYLNLNYETFYNRFKADNRVILQAHPFRDGMVLQNPDLLDGIEVFNCHPHHNSRIAKAAQYAKEHPRLITTCGTDFHHHDHEGMVAMLSREIPENSYRLAEILKSGDYLFQISNTILLP